MCFLDGTPKAKERNGGIMDDVLGKLQVQIVGN
jgi:hypothetical protein